MFQSILSWQAFPTNDRILEGHNTTILERLKIDKNMFNYQFERGEHCLLKWGFTRTFPGNQDATLK